MANKLAKHIVHSAMNDNNFLMHHGVMGMKWGVRRYQNQDGSYTDAGRKRYGIGSTSKKPKHVEHLLNDMAKATVGDKRKIIKDSNDLNKAEHNLAIAKTKGDKRQIKKYLEQVSIKEKDLNRSIDDLESMQEQIRNTIRDTSTKYKVKIQNSDGTKYAVSDSENPGLDSSKRVSIYSDAAEKAIIKYSANKLANKLEDSNIGDGWHNTDLRVLLSESKLKNGKPVTLETSVDSRDRHPSEDRISNLRKAFNNRDAIYKKAEKEIIDWLYDARKEDGITKAEIVAAIDKQKPSIYASGHKTGEIFGSVDIDLSNLVGHRVFADYSVGKDGKISIDWVDMN